MSTRISSEVIAGHNKIPFNLLVDVEDELEAEDAKSRLNTPKLRSIVDKFVGNLSLKKHRRYNPYSDQSEYKHSRLRTFCEEHNNPDELVLDDEDVPRERSSSMENISEISRQEIRADFPSSAFMGRRRSRSESDLVLTEAFARRSRRAAICEEMERGILMENGNTLRKCRKNLVLNQILENLSLL